MRSTVAAFSGVALILTGIVVCVRQGVRAQQSYANKPNKSCDAVVRPYNAEAARRSVESDRLVSVGNRLLSHDPKAAEAAFRQSATLATVPDEALFGLAQALEAQGKSRESLEAYRALTTKDTRWDSTLKREPQVLMHYSLVALQANQWEEAVETYNAGVRRIKPPDRSLPALSETQWNPGHHDPTTLQALAHVCLGQSLAQRGSFTQAIREFTTATEIKPSLSLPYRYLGYELQRTGKSAQAQTAISQADHLDAR